jgi:hypothetical protein
MPMSSMYPLLFPVLVSKFRSYIKVLEYHFELILVQGERHGSGFSFLHTDRCIVFPAIFVEKLSFLHQMFWVPLSKIQWL